ncbi:MAG: hypothetical protein U0350_28595 [Caldilineaceae bacterium]
MNRKGIAATSLALFSRDVADKVSAPSHVFTLKIDKTAPSVLVTGVTDGATYAFGSVFTPTLRPSLAAQNST